MNIKRNDTIKAVITGMVFVIIFLLATWNDTRYTRTGKVYRVDTFKYKFLDVTGNIWEFYVDDIIADGTVVKVTMDTRGTTSYIIDDKVIDYKILQAE